MVLDDFIFAALENRGRIPAGVRKASKTVVPQGWSRAIETEVKNKGRIAATVRKRYKILGRYFTMASYGWEAYLA